MKRTSCRRWLLALGLVCSLSAIDVAVAEAGEFNHRAEFGAGLATPDTSASVRPVDYVDASDDERPTVEVSSKSATTADQGTCCGECNGCGECGCQGAAACGCGEGCHGCRGCGFGSRFVSYDCCGVRRLFGVIRESDHCFDGFISPQTNVLLFEDPRTVTEVRAHFVNQWIPNGNPVFTNGGDAQFAAAQVRLALTERLSFIATKDGYIWLNGYGIPALQTSGVADISAGLKYNVIRNPQTQTIWSLGGVAEAPLSGAQVFQGFGSQVHVFSTAGRKLRLPVNSHWLSGAGLRLPANNNLQSEMIYWSNQWDVEVVRHWYGTFSANWFHWLSSGNNFPTLNFEGGDLFNLGSGHVAGTDIVTLAWGARFKPNGNREFGVAYENPVSQQRGLMASRIYVDAIFRF